MRSSVGKFNESASGEETPVAQQERNRRIRIAFYAIVSFFYWYWMVFGALASNFNLPGVPSGLPLVPGWPPSASDMEPVMADSNHFFFLSTLLRNKAAPYVQPLRLALFNIAEAWIFGFFPLLCRDPKRISNRLVLFLLWSVVGINLTNAFLAPYLLYTELPKSTTETVPYLDSPPPPVRRYWLFPRTFGGVSLSVVAYALYAVVRRATIADWKDLCHLVRTDRTYLAFAVDLLLFAIFQPLLLGRVRREERNESNRQWMDAVPFFGLIAWLFQLA